MKACHFLMLTDWFEEMIRNWLQLVCTSFRIKWVKRCIEGLQQNFINDILSPKKLPQNGISVNVATL